MLAMSNSRNRAQEVLRIPFALTRTVRAPEGAIRRLRCTEHHGARTWSFDLIIDHRIVDATSSRATNYSAAVVQLPCRPDGRLALARRGLWRKAQPLDAPELDSGSEALQRCFTVRGTSPELASTLLDERLCAWLTGPGSHFHYEIVHDRALAYSRRRYLGGSGPLNAALSLAAHLPGHK
jgi:hypothetical protein